MPMNPWNISKWNSTPVLMDRSHFIKLTTVLGLWKFHIHISIDIKGKGSENSI